ncbi:MAG: glycosyltransferase family 39 protein [Bryobacteraceae bacterium]
MFLLNRHQCRNAQCRDALPECRNAIAPDFGWSDNGSLSTGESAMANAGFGVPARALWHGALLLVIGIGAARIVSTYKVFSQTSDEPMHLACGMEWLDLDRYQYETQHPPLARIFVAIGPYLDGSRSHGTLAADLGMLREGNEILYATNYWRTLALARFGILPFFILACLIVWFWTKHLFGRPAALVAVLLFSNIPPILGHAGVATTDMAAAATLAAALYALTLYLETPTWRRVVLLSLALAAAVASKFSNVAFFPVSLLALVLFRALWNRRFSLRSPRVRWLHGAACIAIVVVAVWSVYRFAWDPVIVPSIDFADQDKATLLGNLSDDASHHYATALLERPLPLGQLVRGLGATYLHNSRGHGSFLFGEYRETGWWYFFPVVLAVKTPIAFLVLAGIGSVSLLRRLWRDGNAPAPLCPLVFAAAILALCMGSKIDLGVRHILILYPLLSTVAGYAVVEWIRQGRAYRYVAIGLVVWLAAATCLAHPDYLAYFNEFAQDRPERVLLESDLDWGQDLHRASIRLKELGARNVAVSYFGNARLSESGLPPVQNLVSCEQPVEWALISVRKLGELELAAQEYPQAFALYSCLSSRQPFQRIGKSMLLYRFADAPR